MNHSSLRSIGITVFSCSLLLLGAGVVSGDISGTVVDDETSAAIEGAIVTVQATDITTTTNGDGEFTLATTTGTDLVIVAGKKFYYYAGEVASDGDTDVEIALEAVPQTDNEDYNFANPVLCNACHGEHFSGWDVSPMANTGNNTWVYDLYDGTGTVNGANGFVYTEDSVHAEDDTESDCAACHQPIRWIQEGGEVALGEFGVPDAAVANGVSCDICHKMADVNVDNMVWPGVFPEVVTITRPETDPLVEAVQYGVVGDVDYSSPGTMRGSYQPQLQSEICGVCHEETFDPNLEDDFLGEDAVPIQTTYSEWAASDYGSIDQDAYTPCTGCHMPESDDETKDLCSVILPSLGRPGEQFHSHDIRGTTADFLENAVTLEMDVEQVGSEVVVSVSIENDQTGHSVPTGVPFRHMILVVEAEEDATGDALADDGSQVLDEVAGEGDPTSGNFEGFAGKVYARVLEDADGGFPVFYTEGAAVKYDTRVVAGETDNTEYYFEVPDAGGTVNVSARLIYRRAIRSELDEKEWETTGLGEDLPDIEEPHFGFLMESAEDSIETVPGDDDPEFKRGDADGNNNVFAIIDALYILEYGFTDGPTPPCLDAADCDGNDVVFPILDALYLLEYGFTNGPAPPAPGPDDCGPDEGESAGCETEPSCV